MQSLLDVRCCVVGELELVDITNFDLPGSYVPVQFDCCPQQFRLELFRDVFVFQFSPVQVFLVELPDELGGCFVF